MTTYIDWNHLQMYFKVIKSGTNRKIVYYFLLVVYSNFCRIIYTVYAKFDVKQFDDLKMSPRSSTVASCESWTVTMYVKCSEDSERKKRKSPFSTTTLSFDAPHSSEHHMVSKIYCWFLTFCSFVYLGLFPLLLCLRQIVLFERHSKAECIGLLNSPIWVDSTQNPLHEIENSTQVDSL